MRRAAWIVALPVLVPLALTTPANAGGNWLDFRREDPVGGERRLDTFATLHVGQEVVAFTSLYGPNPNRRERLDRQGPFFAWLSPGDSYVGDARMPSDATRLAPFLIRWDSSKGGTAQAHLTIPSVPSGEYVVTVCNDPCTLLGFGDYVEGWVTITQTPDEARFRELAQDRKWDLRSREKRIQRLDHEVSELEGELHAALRDLRERGMALRAAGTRLAAARSESEISRPLITSWEVALLAIAVVTAAILIRRRRPHLHVPDTVPEELVETECARV